LGRALVGPTSSSPAIAGAALYGVWLAWGLLYVGQTMEAERRLRDLPVGESHHLANTFPAEIWHRVLVVAWPSLPEAGEPVDRLGVQTVGLALEHRLQMWAAPLVNASRRTSTGGWRDVDHARSRSVGARAAASVDALFASVQSVWSAAVEADRRDGDLPPYVRCVHTEDLLAADDLLGAAPVPI
jgi:hypothetical protein